MIHLSALTLTKDPENISKTEHSWVWFYLLPVPRAAVWIEAVSPGSILVWLVGRHSNLLSMFFSSHVTQTTSWIHPMVSVLNLSCSEENEEDCPRELTDQKSWWLTFMGSDASEFPGFQSMCTNRDETPQPEKLESSTFYRMGCQVETVVFYTHVKDQLPLRFFERNLVAFVKVIYI